MHAGFEGGDFSGCRSTTVDNRLSWVRMNESRCFKDRVESQKEAGREIEAIP